MLQLQSALGVLALLALAWALGENRRAVSWRQMAIGLGVTIFTALVLIKLPPASKKSTLTPGEPPPPAPAAPSFSAISAAAHYPSI